jgi:hypothetical protein
MFGPGRRFVQIPSLFLLGLLDYVIPLCAYHFMTDLAGRLKNRVQLTTDRHRPYLTAVEGAFGSDIDYAQLVKIYGKPSEGDTRYSPAECIGTVVNEVTGDPDPKHVSTSYGERQNLTMRMCMRRFTRLTNAFSKKVENHIHAVALHYIYYDFVRIHQTLRVTPAMEAGVANHAWKFNEIVEMSEAEILKKLARKERECLRNFKGVGEFGNSSPTRSSCKPRVGIRSMNSISTGVIPLLGYLIKYSKSIH